MLSIWDVLFGTSLYGEPLRPTGVGDPVVDADNNYGLIGLHWASLKRFWGTVRRLDGWKPGEVAFSPDDYRPIPVGELDLHALAHHLPGHVHAQVTVPAPTDAPSGESAAA